MKLLLKTMFGLLALSVLSACADVEAQRRYEARQAAIKAAEQSVEGLRAAGRAMIVLRPRLVIEGQQREYPLSAMFGQRGAPKGVSPFHGVGSSLGLGTITAEREREISPEYAFESVPAGEYYFLSASGLVLMEAPTQSKQGRLIKAEYKTGNWNFDKLRTAARPADFVFAPGEVVFLGDLTFSGAVGKRETIKLTPQPGDLEAARSALAKTNPGIAPALAARAFACTFCPGL